MTRDHIVAAMAQAIDEARQHPYAKADAALDAALPGVVTLIAQHGLSVAIAILRGRPDPQSHMVQSALRGMGAAE